ncbi:MAG: M20/M25/M40 family metallo-hydrolase [Acidobacteria bacterium]|nr:M20/M25/M40 family metallo-hydrolase [Acidobacteriota bacterium]
MRAAASFASLVTVVCLTSALDGHQTNPAAVPTTAAPKAPAIAPVDHNLDVRLDPPRHAVTITDQIAWPNDGKASPLSFVLNSALHITASSPKVEEVTAPAAARPVGIDQGSPVPVKRYRVTPTPGSPGLTLTYEGIIDRPLSDPKEEYTRGFRDTSGLIGPEGVYLAGSSVWYPRFNEDFVTFRLQAAAPNRWHVISQGNGTSRGVDGLARWDSGGSMDEIYLVGGPLNMFKDSAGAVETLVYLHEPDASIASKYLTATAQYIEMYRTLIGPYPYGKFALVENFWETGYGMPTFTLLGPQIIRFPFIINSSYPHEILHNWWGNSVFVDTADGNWCEGLTAYMADHLIQEQRGTADEYRRSTLQKYRDYVKTGRDFPLSEFRNRFSAATEAVGYGKALMGFHALRRNIGDDAFRTTVARFYRAFKGKRATFRDLQRTAESVSGKPLAWLFDDLITRTGAPTLQVAGPVGAGSVVAVSQQGGRFVVSGTLRQTQTGAPFVIDVPLVVQTERGTTPSLVRMDKAAQTFSVTTDSRPLALHVDPRFDIFRRLDARETPPSIGQIFGESSILAVLPSKAGAAELDGYRALLKGWQSENHAIEITSDTAISALPATKAVWLLGRTNRFAGAVFGRQHGFKSTPDAIELERETMALAGHTLVVITRHPATLEKAVGWIVADPVAAMPGLGRKLPHYGKYSYLGFEGDEPVNTIKGQWQQSDSPLRVDLRPAGQSTTALTALAPDVRKALAELPPVFSPQALRDHVAYLASPALQGRGLGTAGLEAAARYVAEQFKAYGLVPGGDGGTYFQTFTSPRGEDGQPHEVANVIGVLPGARGDWKNQSAMLCAHLDHLGLGWPDVRKGDEGKIHPGADDNASGVAVLLEMARALGSGEKPPRTIVFAAFTGEEAGRLGSKYYAEHPLFPLSAMEGVINLDTVGRLGAQALTALGTGTATEWQHIFRGASFVTGVESRSVPESIESSDQTSFIEKGVPAVQIFTAAHADYHRTTDTPDKIDVAGLVKVATFVKEGIGYLAERPEPLTNTIRPAAPAPAQPAAGGQPATARRVSFGTVPDFAFEGPGVRVSGLVPDSPAAKAGIKEGDTLLTIDGKPVANLQGFSDLLRALAPGQTVQVVISRGGNQQTVAVTLVER